MDQESSETTTVVNGHLDGARPPHGVKVDVRREGEGSQQQQQQEVNGTDEVERRVDDELGLDYDDIEARYAVSFEEGFDDVLLVDGAPMVDQSKREALLKAIRKIFDKAAAKIKDLEMPVDENGKSKGYLFATFPDAQTAALGLRQVDGYRMDRSHTLTVNRLTDIEKYVNVADEWHEPEIETYQDKEHLRGWLSDPKARDQFVMYRGDDVLIAWNSKGDRPTVEHKRSNWTETYVQWSPKGTFLATFHRQGIVLWGGASWQKVVRFSHPGVKLVDFSPCENYVVTWSNDPISVSSDAPQGPTFFSAEDEGNSIAVWNLRTGVLERTFPLPLGEDGTRQKLIWPHLKWSSDDRYFARCQLGVQISIYQTPGMGLVDKKSLKVEGVVDFDWCPLNDEELQAAETPGEASAAAAAATAKKAKEAVLAYWTPEMQNQPARVTLISVPSRAVIRTKNLFNVSDCKLHWQSKGDYLCVKVDRHTKTKKTIFSNLEIFRVREKECPVEVIEVKDAIIAFAWEPSGNRFAIITSNDPAVGSTGPVTLKTAINFFGPDRKATASVMGNFKLLKSVDRKTCNALYWSPKGRHLVAATLQSTTNWDLEFWDVDFEAPPEKRDEDPGAGVQLTAQVEHYGVTDVEWDPSGRYVATSASMWRHTMENGYALWDLRGAEIQKHVIEKFKQFLWRHRPKTLLSKEHQKKIRKNLREYTRQFDEEDALALSSASKELVEMRQRLISEWNAWRERTVAELEQERERLGYSRRPEVAEANELIEEEIEEVIEEKEEIVS